MRRSIILLLGLMALASCNTVEGVGRDVQGAGEVIEDGARQTKKAIAE